MSGRGVPKQNLTLVPYEATRLALPSTVTPLNFSKFEKKIAQFRERNRFLTAVNVNQLKPQLDITDIILHISTTVQLSRPLTIIEAFITGEKKSGSSVPPFSPVQAHRRRDERKSFTNFPATQPFAPDIHERPCEAIGVQVRGSLWVYVSQHFHKVCKSVFLSHFGDCGDYKSRYPTVTLRSYGPNKSG